jgi:sarcosine oxidase
LRGDELAYYEPDSGVLRPEECVSVQLEAASRLGAEIRTNEKVLSVESSQSGTMVRTNIRNYIAQQVILTAGPWVPGIAGVGYASQLKVMRQVLYWFKASKPAMFSSTGFPVFIWMHGEGDEDYMYGFPMVDGHAGVKVATEQYQLTSNPDAVDRNVSDVEKRQMFDKNVKGRLDSVTTECVHATTCLYTVSSDSGFVVDRHADLENVTVVSACSGHGFKHSAALGEALALRVLNQPSSTNWGAFSLDRFQAET